MYDTNITPFQCRYGTLALNPQILKTRKRLGQELKGCVIYVVKGSLDWCINWSIGIDYSYIKKIDECVCVCVCVWGGGGGGGDSARWILPRGGHMNHARAEALVGSRVHLENCPVLYYKFLYEISQHSVPAIETYYLRKKQKTKALVQSWWKVYIFLMYIHIILYTYI